MRGHLCGHGGQPLLLHVVSPVPSSVRSLDGVPAGMNPLI